ncbi:hypothetical protein [Aquimarina pacifica]|uniref:hypothetical protein n=1 Tax=Aquimarina pacifica TaxID=1296415 RepID=UPI0004715C2A|nr:hypothetical protein [Aquimarina pacifica]
MTLAAHITFYYKEDRLQYLTKVIEGIQSIKAETKIFVYSHLHFELKEYDNVQIIVHGFATKKNNKLHSIHRFYYQTLLGLGLTKLVHPYYLAWVNRKYIEKHVEDFDVQMYIEDDILFDAASFKYWLAYKDLCIQNNYNLGFARVEEDAKNGRRYCSDIVKPLSKIVELEGKKFVFNDINPYYGFWIYDKTELKNFMKSKEWKFKFSNYRVRERSAIGWHGFQMERYKGTLIPLDSSGENTYTSDVDAQVHHMPNNYIGHHTFCKVEYPLVISEIK